MVLYSIYNGEGSGNPLQYSCLENPREGGAWWAAVFGVAQSRTQLKRLSSSIMIFIKYFNKHPLLFILTEVLWARQTNHFCPHLPLWKQPQKKHAPQNYIMIKGQISVYIFSYPTFLFCPSVLCFYGYLFHLTVCDLYLYSYSKVVGKLHIGASEMRI